MSAVPVPRPAGPTPAPPTIDVKRAEGIATTLCHLVMTYAQARGLSTEDLAARSGINRWTIRGLRHRKIKNFPHLLNFVKLLAATDLEVCLVRAEHGMDPLPNPTDDPLPPPYYLTGTEGNLRWPSA